VRQCGNPCAPGVRLQRVDNLGRCNHRDWCNVLNRGVDGLPLDVPLTLTRITHDDGVDGGAAQNHARLCQASAEHFQKCAELPLLCNRDLGPFGVTVLPIPLARRAAATACSAVQCRPLGIWPHTQLRSIASAPIAFVQRLRDVETWPIKPQRPLGWQNRAQP
jgi:hypothetical protein